MKFRIDLHVHTKFSGDNDADPEEIVRRAISLGLDGIAFTEHYSYRASEHAEELKERFGTRIRILRGTEFSSLEGHCLIFGVNSDLLPSRAPVAEVIAMVNRFGGAAIPSHPYRRGNSLGDLLWNTSALCAVEGYNGCNMPAFNEKAVEVARALRIPFTGGSDAHSPGEVGSCYTEFDDEVTDANFIDLLKRGNYRGIDTRNHATTGAALWAKLLRR
jgi:hypothetical protein